MSAADVTMPKAEPSRLLCPITQVMFRDPVFTDTGNTYERAAILQFWKQQTEIRDPLHNISLKSKSLKPNWDKRRDVEEFLQEWPAYVPEGWASREVLPPDKDWVLRDVPPPGNGTMSRNLSPSGSVGDVHIHPSTRPGSRGLQPLPWSPPYELLVVGLCLLGMWLCCCWDTRAVYLVPSGGGPSRRVSIKHISGEMASMSLSEVLSTMETHLSVSKVQSHGCIMLSKLAVHEEHQLTELASLDPVPRIVEAMRAHPRAREVQEHACGALWNFAKSGAPDAKLKSSGAAQLLEDAIRTHHQAIELRWHCCGALQELADDSRSPKLFSEGAEVQQLCVGAVQSVTEVEL